MLTPVDISIGEILDSHICCGIFKDFETGDLGISGMAILMKRQIQYTELVLCLLI